jgi:hypothetical protein
MTVNKAVREIVFRTVFSLIAIFGYKIIILGCRRAAELLTGHNNATGKYEEGIVIFDQIEKQALEMADVMINGIIKQFPNIFR